MGKLQRTKKEQINDWLETILFDNIQLKENILTCKNNKDDHKNLKKVQKLYGNLSLIKRVKNGECKILGFDKRKLIRENTNKKNENNIIIPKI